MNSDVRVRLGEGGRIVIPAEFRQVLGIEVGDQITLRLEEGELRILSLDRAIRRAQALVRQYVEPGRSLSQELIDERRREAGHE